MTTTTASNIINGALSALGVVGAGQSASGSNMQTCFDRLNEMVDSWNAERLFIYTVQTVSHAVAAGTSTITIGDGASIDVTRPVTIEDSAYFRLNGIDFPLRIVNKAQYDSLTLKSEDGGYPWLLYYDANVPVGTLYLWPLPSAPGVLCLPLQQQLSAFADTGSDYDFPPGYTRALRLSLAEELQADYGRDLPVSTIRQAAKARASIKRINAPNDVLGIDARLFPSSAQYDINSDS